MQKNRKIGTAFIRSFFAPFVVLLAISSAMPSYGQDITGRWVATGKPLNNGEPQKLILVLKQWGNELKGRLEQQLTGYSAAALARFLKVPNDVSQDLTHFTTDPRLMLAHREHVAQMIERLQRSR